MAGYSKVLLMVLCCTALVYSEWDSNGYVLFCPCQGRFGNQVSHFLGALQFAKDLNRTLALPPFMEYMTTVCVAPTRGRKIPSKNVPFREWFKPEVVGQYHRYIELEEFIKVYAPEYWPVNDRPGYCYEYKSDNNCYMKSGRSFWDDLGIDFTRSIVTQLSYDTHDPSVIEQWKEKFPASSHPVLAFNEAPAPFPVDKMNRHLQKYLKWSDQLMNRATKYITKNMNDEPFIAVHLRIAKDWEKACQHGDGQKSFMESMMCIEDLSDEATITQKMCYPSTDEIVGDISSVVHDTGINNVYIGSDTPTAIEKIRNSLKKEKVNVYYMNPDGPQLDVVMFELSTHFIANCVSSLSAIAVRARNIDDKPSSYLGLITSNKHDEL